VRLPSEFAGALRAIVGDGFVRTDAAALEAYGTDGMKRAGHPADVVVLPDGAAQISAILTLCSAHRVPIVPRGAGTGYTGGAVPLAGGVVLSLERMNRILEIDEDNLVAVVEPNVITGDIQDAVEKVGLFYPPDPASLRLSVIGGNVAECAGGPRAFKYGTTKQYVLGLQAVLPNGDIIETGGKVVKNVVGYDLTHLLVGSEGTLAIVTRIILRLVPKPPVQSTLRATFATIADATQAVNNVIKARVVPAAVDFSRTRYHP
jgi:glycolate oxidase